MSSKPLKTSIRHRARKPKENQIQARKPDIDELRHLRSSYFGYAQNVRRKPAVHAKPDAQAGAQASSQPQASSNEHGHRGRSHRSSLNKVEGGRTDRRKSYSRRRTEEFVYGNFDPAQPDERRGNLSTVTAGKLRRLSESSTSSKRSNLSTVAEDDIRPDESASQIGAGRGSRRRKASSKPRPRETRRSTTPAALTARPESAAQSIKGSTSTSQSPGNLGSSFFGSLLRRNTTTSIPVPTRTVECLTCGSDDIPITRSAKLECGHRMCNDCLKRIFEMSVKDPAHMPPKCCTNRHIPLKHVDKLFDLRFKILWNRKYQEYHTRDRIYCPAPKCGEWIKPSHFRNSAHGRRFALCPRCKTKVCVLCGAKAHKTQDCPKDPAIALLVQQAREEGWQRCYSCRALVERKEGCNHMTCRCQAEFCIVCGAKWKSCECPWFDDAGGGGGGGIGVFPAAGDVLNDMRVPEPLRIFRWFAAGPEVPEREAVVPPEPAIPAPAPARPPPVAAAVAAAVNANANANPGAARNNPRRNRTYAGELEQRRRQEQLDADLARRMQLADLFDSDDEIAARPSGDVDVNAVQNAADDSMQDDIAQAAATGGTNSQQRVQRAAGRRRRPRTAQPSLDEAEQG